MTPFHGFRFAVTSTRGEIGGFLSAKDGIDIRKLRAKPGFHVMIERSQ